MMISRQSKTVICRAIALLCSALLVVSCASIASAQIVADWNWGTSIEPPVSKPDVDDVQLGSLGTETTSGSILNRIGLGGPITNGLIDKGGNAVTDMVGALSFIQQIEGDSSSIDQFRLRKDGSLNPEITANYTQLYWTETAGPASLAMGTISIGVKNNQGFQDLFAAIQDTNGDWFLGQTSVLDQFPAAGNGQLLIDVDTELWAPYTPATDASTSLQLAPTSGFAPFTGEAQAVGFFMQDTDGITSSRRFRITNVVASVIPEPGTLALAGLASLSLIARRRN